MLKLNGLDECSQVILEMVQIGSAEQFQVHCMMLGNIFRISSRLPWHLISSKQKYSFIVLAGQQR